MLHAHVSSWIMVLVLFIVVLLLHKLGKAKGAKITHMVLRLFLLLTAITGIGMVFQYHSYSAVMVALSLKVILSLYVLFLIEKILVRTKKGTLESHYWIQFILVVATILYLGLGVLPFSFMG
ncbi:hypothetical protein CIB95_01255 [Lottiidibacillus patelloidae]|uniref:Uncharacterized protein n=1 Tax=Lottiidibacillus patelloidae TaxID=2670334 RepID=A0A263BWX0_9BACI|nr:DUF1516 family protein [Lottiidibacillus patelloidae]OZM58229.1 hypothetical protein CIB95_01255 [Lottiidibacillus patelloidae]